MSKCHKVICVKYKIVPAEVNIWWTCWQPYPYAGVGKNASHMHSKASCCTFSCACFTHFNTLWITSEKTYSFCGIQSEQKQVMIGTLKSVLLLSDRLEHICCCKILNVTVQQKIFFYALWVQSSLCSPLLQDVIGYLHSLGWRIIQFTLLCIFQVTFPPFWISWDSPGGASSQCSFFYKLGCKSSVSFHFLLQGRQIRAKLCLEWLNQLFFRLLP